MNTWYYAEDGWRQRGPFTAQHLAALFHSGDLHSGTLVWRVGLSQWQPLAVVATELGINASVIAVAPLPPLVPRPAPALISFAVIALITIAASGGLLLMGLVIGAVALSLYQAHRPRTSIENTVSAMAAHKAAITAFVIARGRCPDNGDGGFGEPASYAEGALSELRFGRFDNRHCGMEGLLSAPGQALLDGKAIWLDYDDTSGQWQCSSDIDDRHLPLECRG